MLTYGYENYIFQKRNKFREKNNNVLQKNAYQCFDLIGDCQIHMSASVHLICCNFIYHVVFGKLHCI